jgi:hypothetical protein
MAAQTAGEAVFLCIASARRELSRYCRSEDAAANIGWRLTPELVTPAYARHQGGDAVRASGARVQAFLLFPAASGLCACFASLRLGQGWSLISVQVVSLAGG